MLLVILFFWQQDNVLSLGIRWGLIPRITPAAGQWLGPTIAVLVMILYTPPPRSIFRSEDRDEEYSHANLHLTDSNNTEP